MTMAGGGRMRAATCPLRRPLVEASRRPGERFNPLGVDRVMPERVSVVFGGSILAPATLDAPFLAEVAQALAGWAKDRQLFVVTGGGWPARAHIQAARHAGVAEDLLDRIGIAATRLNAQTLACILRRQGADVNLEVPRTATEAVRLAQVHPIVVMGGTQPGHSTDHVAVEIAVEADCDRFVNATNVEGVYTRDPAKHKDARFLPELDFEALLGIIEEREWTAAGAPGVMDGPATVLLARHAVETAIVHGRDLANLGLAVTGKPFHGTRIRGAKVKV